MILVFWFSLLKAQDETSILVLWSNAETQLEQFFI